MAIIISTAQCHMMIIEISWHASDWHHRTQKYVIVRVPSSRNRLDVHIIIIIVIYTRPFLP